MLVDIITHSRRILLAALVIGIISTGSAFAIDEVIITENDNQPARNGNALIWNYNVENNSENPDSEAYGQKIRELRLDNIYSVGNPIVSQEIPNWTSYVTNTGENIWEILLSSNSFFYYIKYNENKDFEITTFLGDEANQVQTGNLSAQGFYNTNWGWLPTSGAPFFGPVGETDHISTRQQISNDLYDIGYKIDLTQEPEETTHWNTVRIPTDAVYFPQGANVDELVLQIVTDKFAMPYAQGGNPLIGSLIENAGFYEGRIYGQPDDIGRKRFIIGIDPNPSDPDAWYGNPSTEIIYAPHDTTINLPSISFEDFNRNDIGLHLTDPQAIMNGRLTPDLFHLIGIQHEWGNPVNETNEKYDYDNSGTIDLGDLIERLDAWLHPLDTNNLNNNQIHF